MTAGDTIVRSRPELGVPFEAEAFPPGLEMQSIGALPTDWDDILWAAMTVGRPNRYYVFRHGDASAYEAVFRVSLTRMTLQQSGPRSTRLQRTEAYRTLDPTEKGAVSYFLGLTMCKLFAAKLLDTPWLLHLDVYGDRYRPLLVGRSRPDLFGLSTTSRAWTAFECKGRGTRPDGDTKRKAKEQARRLKEIGGARCRLHVSAFTYFERDRLNFYWADPPAGGEPIEIFPQDEDWQHYYLPVVNLFRARGGFADHAITHQLSADVPELDLRIEVAPSVAHALRDAHWNLARQEAMLHAAELRADGFQPDGLRIIAGASWRARLQWPTQSMPSP
jgi:hypothetical protein